MFSTTFSPSPDELLEGHNGWAEEQHQSPPPFADGELHQRSCALQQRASAWVQQAATQLLAQPATSGSAAVHVGPADHWGVRHTTALNTQVLGPSFFSASRDVPGITLCELFGGMAAGLEMLLRNGVCVRRYLYCDIDPAARAVAQHRVSQFLHHYPTLIDPSAVSEAFSLLPHDVRCVGSTELVAAGALDRTRWLVVAGWECQDLSPAGNNKGLNGPKSSTFFDCVRIIGALQQLQRARPPAYLLENAAMQHNFNSASVRERDFPAVCAAIGTPVCLDAAQLGSHAHRLRNYWTNLVCAQHLCTVFAGVQRPSTGSVDGMLDAGRRTQPVRRDDTPPFYVCNKVGQPMQALPTLVSFPASRAFSKGGPGLLVTQQGQLVELSPEERERVLGYAAGATAAPGVSAMLRHTITGRSMDANVMQSLFAVSSALVRWGRARACCIAVQSTPVRSAAAPVAAVQSRYSVGYRILQSQGRAN